MQSDTSAAAIGATYKTSAIPKRLRLLFGTLLTALFLCFSMASSASAINLGVQWDGIFEHAPGEMGVVGKSGAGLFRIKVVPTKTNGGKDWTYYDEVFGNAARNGATILPYLEGRFDGQAGLPSAGEKTAWTEWAKEAVRRYGYNGVYWSTHPEVPARPAIAWEMWNEPNNSSFGTITAAEYGAFLAWAGKAVQTASESWGGGKTGVLFGGLLAWGTGTGYQTFLKNAYNVSGAAGAITGIAIHPYELDTSSFPGQTRIQAFESAVSNARSFINGLSNGSGKSLWITETGWPVGNGIPYAISESEQSSLLTLSFDWAKNNAAAKNIQAIIWYNFRDLAGNAEWQYNSGLRDASGKYRESWSAFQKETGAPEWPTPPTTAFQASSGELWVQSPKTGAENLHLGMGFSPSNPSVTSMWSGGYQIALRAVTNELWTYSSYSGATNLHLGMTSGSNPSIAPLPGGYVIAFQANSGELWIYSSYLGAVNLHLGMGFTASSPSIAVLTDGSYVIAFRSGENELWTYSSKTGAANMHLGMYPGANPSIAALPGGGYAIAFQANSGELWTYTSGGGATTQHLGMGFEASTPGITAVPSGDYRVAFRSGAGELWTYSPASGAANLHLGMGLQATAPGITVVPGGGYEISFKASTNELWKYSSFNGGAVNLGLGMTPGSSPSITASG